MWIFGLIEFISYFISYATYWMEGMCKISSLPRNCVVSFKVINWVFSVGSNPILWIQSSGFLVVKVALLLFLYSIVFNRTQIQQTSNYFELDVVSMFEPIQRLFQFKCVQKSMKSVIFVFDPTLIERSWLILLLMMHLTT